MVQAVLQRFVQDVEQVVVQVLVQPVHIVEQQLPRLEEPVDETQTAVNVVVEVATVSEAE